MKSLFNYPPLFGKTSVLSALKHHVGTEAQAMRLEELLTYSFVTNIAQQHKATVVPAQLGCKKYDGPMNESNILHSFFTITKLSDSELFLGMHFFPPLGARSVTIKELPLVAGIKLQYVHDPESQHLYLVL